MDDNRTCLNCKNYKYNRYCDWEMQIPFMELADYQNHPDTEHCEKWEEDYEEERLNSTCV